MIENNEYINELLQMNYDKDNYIILYNKLLNYKINLACQTIICLYKDLRKDKIFNAYDVSLSNKGNYLYLMILPVEGSTRVILYMNKNHVDNNQNFIDDFSVLNEDDQLHLIFIILIMYTEQFYMNPDFKNMLAKDKKLVRLYKHSDVDMFGNLFFNKITKYKKYNNYLLEKYNKLI